MMAQHNGMIEASRSVHCPLSPLRFLPTPFGDGRGPSLLWCLALSMTPLLMLGAQCGSDPTATHPIPIPPGPVTYTIDPTIQRTQTELPGLDHGPPRAVGAMVGPNGSTLEFVSNEIVFRPSSDAELQEFITRYGATVLRDGAPLVHPEVELRADPTPSGWYLLRIDASTSAVDDLGDHLSNAGAEEGEYRFSSEEAARTLAVFARERARGIGLNPLVNFEASYEHPTGPGTSLDAETFAWFTEDDNPFAPDDQGYSTGVTHAWDYLSYHGILEASGLYYLPKIAIIDGGFDLDEVTGVPLNGNLDYGPLSPPIQYDIVDRDFRAGGPNLMKCSGGSDCPWHGQGSFGIAAARPGNLYGSAGVGGRFVRPILIRVGTDMYHVAYAIRSAVLGGADVVSLSLGGGCGDYHWLCSIPPSDIYDMMLESVRFARSYLVPVVAAAGNGPIDVAGQDIHPCMTEGVICVGSVDGNKINVWNYGDRVDIWAPTGMRSTTTPDSIAADAAAANDNFGDDELYFFGGTSASTPFIAGAIGLMKTADQNLSYEQVLSILQSTANASPDPLVQKGYVDVYGAVRGLIVNQPPSIQLTQPINGQTIGWRTTPFIRTIYTDPEVDPTNLALLTRFHGTVVVSSSVDGELCRATALPYDCTSTKPNLTIGQHVITATATDPFGETSTHQITVTVANRPPEPDILKPLATDTLYSHIPVKFEAFVPDPDEMILDENVSWSSSVDGPLGLGRDLTQSLTAGSHTITLTAVDGKGLSATDQVSVTVVAGAGFPTPVITMPLSGVLVFPGLPITLQGTAIDPENGTLNGASLEWSSNVDGVLGTGNSIQVTLSYVPNAGPCPGGGQHTITLKATDSDGHVATVSILVRVGCII